MPGELLTVAELAAATKMSRAFWRKVILAGEIEVMRLGVSVRVSRAALDAFLEQAGGPQNRGA